MAFIYTLLIGTAIYLFLMALCIMTEHVAVIERFTMRQRLPGMLMNVVGTAGGIGLAWPLKQLWNGMGLKFMVPLWQYLQPLGLAGYIVQFTLLVALADFLAYWRHRVEHSRWWWPVHKVHHSPTELHAANDIGHPIQALFTLLFVGIPLSLIQIDGPGTPWVVGWVVALLSIYIHSPIDFQFGPLRRVFVDNRFHRIHHSLEPRHFDKNFGICFSLWDQLFGTAYFPVSDEWPRVGVADVRPPGNVREFLALPFDRLQAERSARRDDDDALLIPGPVGE